MSGICGIVFRERPRAEQFDGLPAMVRELDVERRGVGDCVVSSNVGFGAYPFPGRLSGIARRTCSAGTSVLALHGSVYNLSDILGDAGAHDTPLTAILDLMLHDSRALLERLRGEFVCALWDARQERLLLACDRFRIHPLFVQCDHDTLVFASRMRSLLESRAFSQRTVNVSSIVDVISTSFIPTPRTVFHEVQKIPPGHMATWTHGTWEVQPYWDISFSPPSSVNVAALSETLRTTFSDSVNVRLRYDQKPDAVGSFLSGGIDSSTVLGVLSQLAGTSMKSFSIGFGEEQFNETSFARCAARAFDAHQHEYIVTPDDTFRIIDQLVESFDEPYANASAIPTFFCAKLAKDHGVETLYGGDGGDELFAGNERYATQKVFDYYKMFPRWMRDYAIEPLVRAGATLLPLPLLTKGTKYIHRANIPYPDRLFSWGLFEVLPIDTIFTKDFLASLGDDYDPHRHVRELYERSKQAAVTELDRQLYMDLKLAISDNDVLKVTRMTEANGIAVRFPFLDHRLAEFAGAVPAGVKMQGTKLRTFFKDAYADVLPEEIRTKTKHGFGLPIPVWLRTDKRLRELMLDLLCSDRSRGRGYMKKDAVDRLIQRHQDDTTSFFGTMLWNCVMLELWLRRYSDAA